MSSGRNTHWCHTCLRPIRLCSRYVICSYCAGEFVQALNEMTGSSTVNFNSLGRYAFHDTNYNMMDDGRSSVLSIDRVEELYGNVISFRPFTEYGPRSDQGLAVGGEFPSLRERELLFTGGSGSTGESRQTIDAIRDYLMGPGLEELIEQLSSRSVTRLPRRGPPPATRSSINAMPTIKIKQSHLCSDSHCPICLEIFELGSKAKQMPCKHIYHSDCIVTWLNQNHTCPVCRYKMPTSHVSTSTGQGSSTMSSNRQRRNPFSFLWRSRSSSSSA